MREVVNVRAGKGRYEALIGQIRNDVLLLAQMRADAEHDLVEHLDKVWTFVTVNGLVAAWCAAQPVDGVLTCSDNYERRGVGRELGLYRVAYRHRHETVVAPCELPAVTYLFAQPIALHEADGWRRTGLSGVSEHGHRWWELRRL